MNEGLTKLEAYDERAWHGFDALPSVARARRDVTALSKVFKEDLAVGHQFLKSVIENAGWSMEHFANEPSLFAGPFSSDLGRSHHPSSVFYDPFADRNGKRAGVLTVSSLKDLQIATTELFDNLVVVDVLEQSQAPDRLFGLLFDLLRIGGRFLIVCRLADLRDEIDDAFTKHISGSIDNATLERWVRSRSNNFGVIHLRDIASVRRGWSVFWGIQSDLKMVR